MSDIMLFPLRSVVFPQGKLKLRIFEPRYLRMVTECFRNNQGFGMCLINDEGAPPPRNVSTHGTYVNIVDFEELEDGMLGITVVGDRTFETLQISTDVDGLRRANVNWLPPWPNAEIDAEFEYVSAHLRSVYENFPQISELYDSCHFDDAVWVAQRWLELLPLKVSHFEFLSVQANSDEALVFLSHAIEAPKSH
ncbi:LON peptidase substrate-binding domain-containing protein [Vibrio astriarenae]|uniref:LON peptidase substrate-binding domain-containing protein n=1 Tax=Vibrio astriarenae TaxID=1481923 RepID=UPI00373515F2